MNKEIREKAEKFWKELCENASAWDNDDGKMAEANEKTPVDLLEDVFIQISKEAKEDLEEEQCIHKEALRESDITPPENYTCRACRPTQWKIFKKLLGNSKILTN